MCVPQCVCGGTADNVREPVLSYPVGPRDRIQVARFGGKLFHLLCHPAAL